jgi:hypothetical protein
MPNEQTKMTAMQVGIQELEKRIVHYNSIPSPTDKEKAEKEMCISALKEAITVFTMLLPLEKNNIVDARTNGIIKGHKISNEDYYTTHFKPIS